MGVRGERGDKGLVQIISVLDFEIQKFATHGNNRIKKREKEDGRDRRYSSGPISNTVEKKCPIPNANGVLLND